MPSGFGPVCHADGIRGFGNLDADVMIVGIAPGFNEMREGRPLVGQSGKFLDAVLKACGQARSDVYCTNLICWLNNEPSPTEVSGCASRLAREIELVKPKLIIALGKIAAEELLPYKFGSSLGGVFWSEKYNAYVLPTIHPAAVLRGSSGLAQTLVRDFSKVAEVLTWPAGGSYYCSVSWTIANHELAQAFLDKLENVGYEGYVGVDIETVRGKRDEDDDTLDVWDDSLLCLAISTGSETIVVSAEDAQGLRWPDLRYTFHNGPFDVQGIDRFLGVRLQVREDTMLMSYMLDERSGGHKLKGLAREYLGVGFYEEDVDRKNLDQAELRNVYQYNAYDAAYTVRLAGRLAPMMAADNVEAAYRRTLIPATNVFADVQLRGVAVSEAELNLQTVYWGRRFIKMSEDLEAEATQYGYEGSLNLNSPKQLGHFLFGTLGLPIVKRTPKGAPSTDKDVLEELAHQHPFMEHLTLYRRVDRAFSGFLVPIRSFIKRDQLLHANALLHVAVTGRTAYRDPAMQTIPTPKMNADLGRIRNIIVPRSEEYILVEADYEKAELWAAVSYSGDRAMLSDLQSGDFHSRAASAIFGVPLEQVTPAQRINSKHVTFGVMYGRQPRALAKGELKCSVEEATRYRNNLIGKYPQFYDEWATEIRRQARSESEIVSLTGRKRRFPYIAPDDFEALNQAVNFPIQSLASDTTLQAMIALHPILADYDSRILFMIHDSLTFEIRREHLDDVLKIIHQTMTRSYFEGTLPVPVELGVGERWGEIKKVQVPA